MAPARTAGRKAAYITLGGGGYTLPVAMIADAKETVE